MPGSNGNMHAPSPFPQPTMIPNNNFHYGGAPPPMGYYPPPPPPPPGAGFYGGYAPPVRNTNDCMIITCD